LRRAPATSLGLSCPKPFRFRRHQLPALGIMPRHVHTTACTCVPAASCQGQVASAIPARVLDPSRIKQQGERVICGSTALLPVPERNGLAKVCPLSSTSRTCSLCLAPAHRPGEVNVDLSRFSGSFNRPTDKSRQPDGPGRLGGGMESSDTTGAHSRQHLDRLKPARGYFTPPANGYRGVKTSLIPTPAPPAPELAGAAFRATHQPRNPAKTSARGRAPDDSNAIEAP